MKNESLQYNASSFFFICVSLYIYVHHKEQPNNRPAIYARKHND